jgi:hypothetical protein
MNVVIASVGLATAQGGVFDVTHEAALRPPAQLSWPADRWTTCHSSYGAAGIGPTLSGSARWSALARQALQECFGSNTPSPETPLLVASCNGAAAGFDPDNWRHAFDSQALLEGTGWASKSLPVFSTSCTSGLHALYLARQLLLAGYADEVSVLAVDILSPASHDNFEVLRVLSDTPSPWQAASRGFMPGEAAVALRLVRTPGAEGAPGIDGPTLGNDLQGHDGLSTILSELKPRNLKLVLGQGTGPFESDGLELSALRASVSPDVPLSTPLAHFGHTLGASSLLSVALAALACRAPGLLPVLSMDAPAAVDGRPLFNGPARGDNILVTCRAMSGACAATCVGPSTQTRPRSVREWYPLGQRSALMHPTLRHLASEALRYRPQAPPDILLVRMDEPLLPDERAGIGGRLLPSAVLELTPGFVSQLIARCWGHTGGALCLVGQMEGDRITSEMVEACVENGLTVSRINLRGGGVDERAVEWNA